MIATEPLLQAILDEPGRDDLRLVYADMTEEQGQEERAEFIRVQVELATLVLETTILDNGCISDSVLWVDKSRYDQLRQRERELMIATASRCQGGYLSDWASAWTANRGFINTISCTLTDWLQHGPAIVRCQPVEKVVVTDRKPRCWHPDGYYFWNLANKGAELQNVIDFGPGLIPWDVYWIMPGALDGYHAEYSNEAAAMAALSAGCIAWAKEQSL